MFNLKTHPFVSVPCLSAWPLRVVSQTTNSVTVAYPQTDDQTVARDECTPLSHAEADDIVALNSKAGWPAAGSPEIQHNARVAMAGRCDRFSRASLDLHRMPSPGINLRA